MSASTKPSNQDRGKQKMLIKSYMRPILNVSPGPKDPSILTLQEGHRSSQIWENEQDIPHTKLRVRCGRVWIPHHNLHRIIMDAGFLGIMQMQPMQLDHALMTALVERWRQETHTFHFPVGEMTITLEDVAMLFGLPIDGYPVTGSHNCDWVQLCKTELGLTPGDSDITGSSLQLRWLSDNFSELPEAEDYDAEIYRTMIKRFAKAWLLAIIGTVLCPSSSGDTVSLSYLLQLVDLTKVITYSWGSAVLANLYRGLCRATRRGARELSGCALLLQLWSWERLHIGRPEVVEAGIPPLNSENRNNGVNGRGEHEDVHAVILHPDIANSPDALVPWGHRWGRPRTFVHNPRGLHYYRSELDSQKSDEVNWRPYETVNEAEISPLCFSGQDIWRARVPLICYDVVEWHFPDRVLRQFGLLQGIPIPCDTELKLHKINKRGRHSEGWDWVHCNYVKVWEERGVRVENSRQIVQGDNGRDKYLQWYRKITRLFVARPEVPNQPKPDLKYHSKSALWHRMVETLTKIAQRCATGSRDPSNTRQGYADIRSMCISTLASVGELERVADLAEPVVPPARRRQAKAQVMERGESSNGPSRPLQQTLETQVRERGKPSNSRPSRPPQPPQEPRVRQIRESTSRPIRPLPRPTQETATTGVLLRREDTSGKQVGGGSAHKRARRD